MLRREDRAHRGQREDYRGPGFTGHRATEHRTQSTQAMPAQRRRVYRGQRVWRPCCGATLASWPVWFGLHCPCAHKCAVDQPNIETCVRTQVTRTRTAVGRAGASAGMSAVRLVGKYPAAGLLPVRVPGLLRDHRHQHFCIPFCLTLALAN